MVLLILSLTFLIQLFTIIMLYYRREESLRIFLLFSLLFTLFISLILYFKVHHVLRDHFNISNTWVYLLLFAVSISFLIPVHKNFSTESFWLVIPAFVFWGLSRVIDLISDGRIILIENADTYERILLITGSVFWLLFYLKFLITDIYFTRGKS